MPFWLVRIYLDAHASPLKNDASQYVKSGRKQRTRRFLCELDQLILDDTFLKIHVS